MTKQVPHTLLFRTLTIGLWLVAIILAAEAAVHFAFDPPVSLVSRDPVLGWRYVASRKIGKQPDGKYFLTTNSRGFRGRDFNEQKDSKYRIMVLGDSYTAGASFADDQIFTTLLEAELNHAPASAKSIEIMNVGISAWSTDQQLLYFQREGAAYHPDLVIVAMAPNDIREAYGKKLLTLEPNGKLLEHPTPAIGFADSTKWWLLNHSAIAQWLGRKYGFADIFPILQRHYEFSFPIKNREATDVDLFRPALPEPLPQAHALWEAEISKLAEEVTAAGGKLVLTVLPTKMEFQHPLNAGDPDLQPGYVSEYAKGFAAKKQIPFIDLWARIKSEKDPLSLFIADEYHFNEAGHQFVAKELAASLRVMKLISQ